MGNPDIWDCLLPVSGDTFWMFLVFTLTCALVASVFQFGVDMTGKLSAKSHQPSAVRRPRVCCCVLCFHHRGNDREALRKPRMLQFPELCHAFLVPLRGRMCMDDHGWSWLIMDDHGWSWMYFLGPGRFLGWPVLTKSMAFLWSSWRRSKGMAGKVRDLFVGSEIKCKDWRAW